MRLSFGMYSIELVTHTCRRELDSALQKIGARQEVIDVANGEGNAFYVLKFKPEIIESPESGSRFIGLCSSRTGIEPQILLNTSTKQLYLGLDSSLLIFTIPSGPTRCLNLDGPFYSMTLFQALERILVVHEIGLLWLDTSGDIVWHHDASDVISAVIRPAPDTLELRLFEGGRTALDLTTGRVLKKTPK
jgi:hypothetical protein